jgi:hypothetical protein
MMAEMLLENMSHSGERLRIGLLVGDRKLSGPAAQLISQLQRCRFVDVVAAIVVEPCVQARSVAPPFVYNCYYGVDALIHRKLARALAPRDCAALMTPIETFAADRDPLGATRLSDDQITILTARRLHVIISLDLGPEPKELIAAAKFGIWRCWLGRPAVGGVGICQCWRLFNRNGPFSTRLEALSANQPAPLSLAVGTMSLVSDVSVIRNMTVAAQMGLDLIFSSLSKLQAKGWDYLIDQRSTLGQADADSADINGRTPSNLQMMKVLGNQVARYARRKLNERNTREHWKVGIRSGCQLQGLEAACAPQGYSWIEAPADHYYADPFLITRREQSHLFVEAYDCAIRKGYIAHMPIDRNGRVGPAQTVLNLPYHLSYPFVFAHDDEVFMIPESGYNNTVELYRAERFPDRWERVKVLFNGPAADTTVLFHGGLVWFFVTLFDVHAPLATTLLLFYSPTLLGDWTLHPASPISTDIRVARGAGALFMHHGSWFRPAQNGGDTYGGGIRYQRITQIDTDYYAEEHVGDLTRDRFPGAEGTHTYNRDGLIETIDVKVRIKKR